MKYFGRVGFLVQSEVRKGIWEEHPVEHSYYGDIIRNSRKRDLGETPNDDINVSNSISIVADAFAYEHFFEIGYIEWCGALWRVTNVEIQRPRLILTIGGVYNGPRTNPDDSGEDSGE